MFNKKDYFRFLLIALLVLFLLSIRGCQTEKAGWDKIYKYQVLSYGNNIGYRVVKTNQAGDIFYSEIVSYRPYKTHPLLNKQVITYNLKPLELELYKDTDFIVNRSLDFLNLTLFRKNGKSLVYLYLPINGLYRLEKDTKLSASSFPMRIDSPETLLPLLRKYDFMKQGKQTINYIDYSFSFFPFRKSIDMKLIGYKKYTPKKNMHSLQFLVVLKGKKYYLSVDSSLKKILSLKARDKSLSVIIIDKPLDNFNVEMTSKIEQHNVRYRSSLGLTLDGTITIPKAEGKLPAILFLPSGNYPDRSNYGIWDSLANILTKNGFITLRYDQRGTGSSSGRDRNKSIFALDSDAQKGIDFLMNHPSVDKNRISVVGHGYSCPNALLLAKEYPNLKSLILLAPAAEHVKHSLLQNKMSEATSAGLYDIKELMKVRTAIRRLIVKIANNRFDWAIIYGIKVDMSFWKSLFQNRPLSLTENISCPISIIHGSRDLILSSQNSTKLQNQLIMNGNQRSRVKVLDNLNHYFGRMSKEGEANYRQRILLDSRFIDYFLKEVKRTAN